MDNIRQYILSVTTAALICSIVKKLTGKKSANGTVVDLICGAFLAVTLLSPWLDWNIQDISIYTNTIKLDASCIANQAQEKREEEMRTIIKKETETYILDKASSMEMDIEVEIMLQESMPIPAAAVITGHVSPYAKAELSRYIKDTFAITEDAQIWNSDQ